MFENKLPAPRARHPKEGCLVGLIVGGRANLAMAQPTWTLFVGLPGNSMLPSSVRARAKRRDLLWRACFGLSLCLRRSLFCMAEFHFRL